MMSQRLVNNFKIPSHAQHTARLKNGVCKGFQFGPRSSKLCVFGLYVFDGNTKRNGFKHTQS